MATYKIAPDTTGEIGMAQMKYGLVNKADYNNSNGVTTEINMQTLVVNSTTYQSDLTSKTWDTSQPYGFGEMYGETWSDAAAATLSYSFTNTIGLSAFSVTVRLGSASGTILYNGGVNSGTLNVSVGDTIYVASSAFHNSDPYTLTAEERVPNSGIYSTLFFDSAGFGGGSTSGSGTFVITSPNTTAGLLVSAS